MTHKPDPRALAHRNRAKPTTTPQPPIAMSPMTPAVTKVLSTPELIEAILLHLDMRTLLTTAQLISRTFHAVIASSPPLQRALFFRPTLPSQPTPFTSNPLLAWAFPCLTPVLKHEPIGRFELHLPRSSLFVPGGAYGRHANAPLPMTDTRGRRHLAFTRRGASWRRMLPCQPPAMRVARVELGPPAIWKLVDFSESGGLRMGVLFDEVFAMNWEPRRSCEGDRCAYNCHGVPAMVLWRVPWGKLGEGGEVVLRDATGNQYCASGEVPRWVGDVDLVLGENWREWTDCRAVPCVHPWMRYGIPEKCFLSQQEYWDSKHSDWRHKTLRQPVGGRGTKYQVMYQCQEYKPGGRCRCHQLSRRKWMEVLRWHGGLVVEKET